VARTGLGEATHRLLITLEDPFQILRRREFGVERDRNRFAAIEVTGNDFQVAALDLRENTF
jgi:hypothetical protein